MPLLLAARVRSAAEQGSGADKEHDPMSRFRRLRPMVTAWLISAGLALASAAVALGSGTGTSYP